MQSQQAVFAEAFAAMPLVAILRGITPEEVLPVADALVAAGLRLIEVPLNSPSAFDSIARLVAHRGPGVAVGAGTVLHADDVERLAGLGAELLVTPNTDPAVVAAGARLGLASVIGCMTPSEAFAALNAGATAVKIFPAVRLGPGYVKDLRAVLPKATRVVAVGGVGLAEMDAFRQAGCDGFGFGSNLYAPGRAAADVGAVARDLVAEWRRLAGA